MAPEEETEKKGEENFKHEGLSEGNKLLQAQASRIISSLPLNSPVDYTPYFGLEFDLAVQDYCRNKNNHIQYKQQRHKREDNQFLWSLSKTSNELKQAYSLDNAPFNKVIRNCKIVVSGDVAVGKTSLVSRFGHGNYSSTYRTTIGVDFDLQKFSILGQPFVLQIWDTAGLERFRCITSSYYRGCQVALLVFDMSNMTSLANVFKWRDEVLSAAKTFDEMERELEPCGKTQLENKNEKDTAPRPLLFLVGTKCDLPLTEPRRTFIREQANKVASMLQAELWFVSAETGDNVNELFSRIAALSFNRCIQSEIYRIKFEASTIGACFKEKLLKQQKDFWNQSSKLIKITKKKDGDDRRSRCVNIQCVIK